MKMIQYKSQLLDYLEKIGHLTKPDAEMHIAVEALIFTPEGKLLLEKRGPGVRDEVGKLEGVGGSIGAHTDLHQALKGRITNELGESVQVKIDQLLEVRIVNFIDQDRGNLEWIVVSYLCLLANGVPEICEPDMVDEIVHLSLPELFMKPTIDLSQSTILAREAYQKKFGEKLFF